MSQTPTGSGRGHPAPTMNMGMNGMGPGPGAGMGYHPYQHPPPHGPPGSGPPPGPGGALPPPQAAMGGHPPPPMMMMFPGDPYAHPPPPGHVDRPNTHSCTVHPPGMPRPFDVPFPERRLPVCDRCKKNFKSRELCRNRDLHRALPWQTTYVAVTILDSALIKGEDGALSYADIPVVAELQDTPLMCLGPSDGSMRSEPICKVCREKNYTRDYCRNTCKHTTPPWNTTYVKLRADDNPNAKSRKPKKRKKRELGADGKPISGEEGKEEETEDQGDDLSKIHASKTFLAAISSKKVIVRWCERIQYPEGLIGYEHLGAPSENPFASRPHHPPAPPPGVMVPYGMPPGGGMHHPGNQLWDAFRAGAMWAQQHGHMPPGYGYGAMPPGYGYGAMPPGAPGAPGTAPGGPVLMGGAPGVTAPGGPVPVGGALGQSMPTGEAPTMVGDADGGGPAVLASPNGAVKEESAPNGSGESGGVDEGLDAGSGESPGENIHV